MIIYIPNIGDLMENMKKAIEFETPNEAKTYLVNQHTIDGHGSLFSEADIVVSKNTYEDPRIGWKDCRFVAITRMLGKDLKKPFIIGLCATEYGSIEQSKRMCKEFYETTEKMEED